MASMLAEMVEDVIPKIGLGTWSLTGSEGVAAILAAIEIGYRHIDTAQSYDTEEPVGLAIERSGLKRDEFFVTTKITAANFPNLEGSLRRSNDKLRVDQVDLALIHWPSPRDEVPVHSYVGALARAQDTGLSRHVGVSNFTCRHLSEARAVLGEGRLATNQVECHVYLQNKILAQYCLDAGIPLTAYMPLAGGRLADDPVLARIASRYQAEATQIALAFLLKRGHAVIPKSSRPERMRSNFEAAHIVLSKEDMAAIDALDRGERHIDPEWGPEWD